MKDFHVHTSFSDGKNTPEEVVLSAISMGLTELGFSDHSYTSYDESCCIPKDRVSEYRDTVVALREKYRGKIKIYCGIEQDYYSDWDAVGFDYIIGSVHAVKLGERYLNVDESAEVQKQAVTEFFGGDYYAFAELYFETVADVVEKTHADIIGHFDLVSKFSLFDESDPRYVSSWKKAVDRLIPYGKPFEINTGAISRGYRTVPYPNPDMIAYIREKGGRFILSSDSHQADTLCYAFEKITMPD